MQPWTRRGFPAELVTGGMPAVGTGVATAVKSAQDRAAQPGPHAGDGTPGFDEFGGDLFSDGPARPTFRRLSGTLDPLHGLLADGREREIPGRHRLTSASRHRKPGHGELAGWVIDTSRPGTSDESGADARSWAGNAEIGTPSEGFHRSLGWTGVVGAVARDDESHLDRDLVVPVDDPAVVTSFDEADSIVELWEGLVGSGASEASGLVTPEAVDLTAGTLTEPPSELYTIPQALVEAALSTVCPPPPAPHDFIPLAIPGEHQEKANEVPNLSDLADVEWPAARWPDAPRQPEPDDSTVPLFGGLDAQDDTLVRRLAMLLEADRISRKALNRRSSTAPPTALIRT